MGKGANYERQLKKMLEEKGYYVVRSAGSGSDSTSPDLIALSSVRKMGFECKAIRSEYLWIESEKIEKYREFELKTAMPVYIAWKSPYRDWGFFPLSAMKESKSGYGISLKELNSSLKLEQII